jgi:hypothetical protein
MTLTLGTGEQKIRIDAIRGFITRMRAKAEENFTDRYGIPPPGGGAEDGMAPTPEIETPANTHIPPAGTKGMSEDGPVTSDGKGWVLDSIR